MTCLVGVGFDRGLSYGVQFRHYQYLPNSSAAIA